MEVHTAIHRSREKIVIPDSKRSETVRDSIRDPRLDQGEPPEVRNEININGVELLRADSSPESSDSEAFTLVESLLQIDTKLARRFTC